MGGPNSPRTNSWPPPQTVWSRSGGSEGSECSPPLSPRVASAEALPAPVVPALWGPGSRNPHAPQFGGLDASRASLPGALRLPPRLAQSLDQLRGDLESSLQRYERHLQYSLAQDGPAAQRSGALRKETPGFGHPGMKDHVVNDFSALLDVSANTVRGEDELTRAAPWSDEPPKAWAEAGILVRNPRPDRLQDATSHAARPTAKHNTPDYELERNSRHNSPLPSESSNGSGTEGGSGADGRHVDGLQRVISSKRSSEVREQVVDHNIRQIIERPRRSPWLRRLASFTFNAKPLISKESRLNKIQGDWRYVALRGVVIMMDTALVLGEVGYSTHMVAENRNPDFLWLYPSVSTPLCMFFWFDMIFTLLLEFPKFDLFFGRTGQRSLNLLAILQQTLALIGAISMPTRRFTSKFRFSVSRFSFLRIFRALLNLPGLGGKWLQKQIGELHIMIRALAGTVQPLLWCSVMVLIILTIFGTFFAESAAQRMSVHYTWDAEPPPESVAQLIESWGGLNRAVFTLFKAMLGGMDWGDAYDSLTQYQDPWGAKSGFIFFICFTYIAFLNTVTAVFIQCAFVRLEKDKNFAIQRDLEEKVDYLCIAQDLFNSLDTEKNGQVRTMDLVNHVQDPDVLAIFQRLQLDLPLDQFEKMFVLMDTDRSGVINMEEFMAGCLRLRGTAKGLDLELLHSDVKYMIMHMETMDGKLASHTQLLQSPRQEPVSQERQAQQLVRLQHDLRLLSAQLVAIERSVNLTIARSEAEFELGPEVAPEPTISL